jgi:hypothetical protein
MKEKRRTHAHGRRRSKLDVTVDIIKQSCAISTMWKNHRAVSAVISTIILLTVVITISSTIAYWMGGISSQYTQIEKIEVGNVIVSSTSYGSATTWTITIFIKNSGTSSTTITDVYLNDKPLANSRAIKPPNPTVGNGGWYSASPTIVSGSSANFIIVVNNGGYGQPFTSLSTGLAVNLKIHSASGVDYLKLVELY